jgi:hypothetical protein
LLGLFDLEIKNKQIIEKDRSKSLGSFGEWVKAQSRITW